MSQSKVNPKITICIPVYNGEKIIERTIQSVLSQTYENFLIVISDNASTDETSNICEKFKAKDSRIQVIKQNNLIPLWNNFDFLLRKVTTEYFMWLAADDFIHPDFIKKTVSILESDKKIVGCSTKSNDFEIHNNQICVISGSKKLSIFSKLGFFLLKSKSDPIIGSYDSRIRNGLLSSAGLIYSVFRTDIAKKCFIVKHNMMELFFLMRIYGYGEVHILDEFLFNYYVGGRSSIGPFKLLKLNNSNLMSYIFPMFKLNSFFLKEFGLIQFFKNFDILFRFSLFHSVHLMFDYLKHIKSTYS
jgi:glycosyltransferase involved in cell wall biosynthesis